MADEMYRSHVGIPIDYENYDPSLFNKLDLVGKIGLENDDIPNQEKHQYREDTDATAMAGKWGINNKRIEKKEKVETLKIVQPKR